MVYEVDHYPGMFRNEKGELYDLRPNDDKHIRPSLRTFSLMDKKKLQQLLLKALEAQKSELQKPDHSPYDIKFETDVLIKELDSSIGRLKKVMI